MKKLLTLVLLCAAALATSAQDFNWGNTPVDTAYGLSSDFEIISTSYFRNDGTDSTFVWHRTSDLPNGWENTVCDLNQCYGEKVDSAEFILAKGDSFKMKANFYANNIEGMGCITLKIISLEDRTKSVEKQFCASTGVSTGPAVLLSQLNLFPNPASNELHVELTKGGQFDIRIMDLRGQVLIEQNDITSHTVVSLDGIKQGVYNIQIMSEGVSVTKNFIKTL